ncbi:nucleoporin [Blastocystis sp. subtype 4]|uniref:nucleoporin n=1 Tax=Blastocystis sp. subtype 4 TaxID=944170 RepID=UPI00071136D8|nr:nucleoporin [Blastocystis sp. subtype 4]KNB41747.1 nucleoporin [Blastocystis sp. subtype 4]|eukprot:XP_014525190.1 nucleoporin [Blastocystis sp. subtype 4]
MMKRAESALTSRQSELDKHEYRDGKLMRRSSSVHYRGDSKPPTMNVFDADVVSCRTDSGKGTNVTYGTMMANGDMYTQSVLHDEAHSSSAYDADYLRKSKPIQFEEEDCEDNTWIRVFGFQPEDVSSVLEQLQRCGYIRERRSTANNYMYLRFYTTLEVQKALALNGTRIHGNYIGVIQCSREEVAEGYEGNLNRVKTSSLDTR